ncbi:hypothetical protein ID866_6401 [Astraeus odoratus]|nr:hypothetical protein ID866_6401 [Astraeus odoratus]
MQPATSDSGFVPRKEFIRDQHTISDFALLAISGSSFIRLYSFPVDVIIDLRRLFDHFYLNAASREDAAQKLCEFQLNGKPWASPKSARTERILLDILAVIYKHGYTILSTINYGRERDDRLAISFSRPSTAPPHSPIPAGSGSNLSHTTPKNERKMPFAISFVSSTTMRVIYPPLNSTPAILQAVRGSWPRGVVSERKVGDAAYEFKLKGYSWFNEDTFATDSLQQILSLLSSLDAHACSMIASLSFNGHSRVKDLWVFIGPGSAESYDQYWPDSPVSPSGSMLDVRRSNRDSTPDRVSNPDAGILPSSLHRRAATGPQHLAHAFPYTQSPSVPHHIRAATESNIHPPYPTTLPLGSPRVVPGNGLRKPAPRAQLPVSVDLEQEEDDHARYRTSLASAVPSSCENMTGVGALGRGRFHSDAAPEDTSGTTGTLDNDDDETIHPPHQESAPMKTSSPHPRVSALRPLSTRSKTPPLLTSHARDSRTSSATINEPLVTMPQPQEAVVTAENPPLLSSGIFRIRDSAFSANSLGTTGSCEVPIKWSGLGRPEGIGNIEEETDQFNETSFPRHASPPPRLPGAWAVPSEEERLVVNGEASHTDKATTRPQYSRNPDRCVHDVDARITSPELVREDVVRKSEAGLIGMISPQPPRPSPQPMPSKESLGRTKPGSGDPPSSPTKTGSRSGSTDRWVLVNLEGKDHIGHASSPLASPTIPQTGDRGRKTSANVVEKGPGSSPAKATTGGTARGARDKAGGSGLRRLLSFSRSGKGIEEPSTNTQLSTSRPHDSTPNGHRSGRFRNKLVRLGTADTPTKPPERVRVKLD